MVISLGAGWQLVELQVVEFHESNSAKQQAAAASLPSSFRGNP